MHLKKWISSLPFFILILSACANPINKSTTIPSTHLPSVTNPPALVSTKEHLNQSTETSTQITPWYMHPQTDPGLLGSAYGLLEISRAPIYETVEDAINGTEKYRLAPEPPAYLAYDQTQSVDGKTYVHLTDGGWMPEVSLNPVSITTFSGLIISKLPTQPFGWVIRDVEGWTGTTANTSSGMVHKRYEVVSVLEQQDGFARLDSNDWVPLVDLALIDLTEIADTPSSSCRRVDINLASQILVVFEKCQLVFATLISSAKAPAITPEGTYTIFYKEEKLPLFANERVATSENFYLADVPWLMFFHENWAIHGAYWHDHFGEPWSHGCINVSPYDALWLYNWSKLGDMIVVHE
jgi:lipoprotein-anchoring transpeptidase ErfK/SrfK